jgi:hypothetical protein
LNNIDSPSLLLDALEKKVIPIVSLETTRVFKKNLHFCPINFLPPSKSSCSAKKENALTTVLQKEKQATI